MVNFVLFTTALMCEVIEGETSYSLRLRCLLIGSNLSRLVQGPSQTGKYVFKFHLALICGGTFCRLNKLTQRSSKRPKPVNEGPNRKVVGMILLQVTFKTKFRSQWYKKFWSRI